MHSTLLTTFNQEEVISSLLRQVSAGQGKGKLLSEIILLLTEMTIFHSTHKYLFLSMLKVILLINLPVELLVMINIQ